MVASRDPRGVSMPRHSNPNYAGNPVQRRAKTPQMPRGFHGYYGCGLWEAETESKDGEEKRQKAGANWGKKEQTAKSRGG